jgi:hypothetical protein
MDILQAATLYQILAEGQRARQKEKREIHKFRQEIVI